ncbi:hypothetical protein [Paraglaciecola arctica]|uniref:Sulfotransferase domain-containing protein n=1 Tax=Paraglaciecola arctica BSs20135 TaxID=493475 RepID=K6Z8Z9_9ALTE|nr:hypothetical protein [Paraglaciecola arctica]GAC19915.1 hypothetical protein GARC_2952 [Paraglaciecola arctica BSs20135]
MSVHNFIVTSHGLSATNWFSKSINMHPEVMCVHGNEKNLFDKAHIKNDEGISISQKNSTQNHGDESIQQHFSSLSEVRTAKSYGSVHYYRLRDHNLQAGFNSRELNFNIANLVRNPVNLVNSSAAHYLNTLSSGNLNMHAEVFDTAVKQSQIYCQLATMYKLKMLDPYFLSFMAACMTLTMLCHEHNLIDNCPHIPMEKLVTDQKYYSEVFSFLTGIEPSESYINQVFSQNAINQHANKRVESAEEQYGAWQEWQKMAFYSVWDAVNKQGGISKQYTKLGYDFSFLTTSPSTILL